VGWERVGSALFIPNGEAEAGRGSTVLPKEVAGGIDSGKEGRVCLKIYEGGRGGKRERAQGKRRGIKQSNSE